MAASLAKSGVFNQPLCKSFVIYGLKGLLKRPEMLNELSPIYLSSVNYTSIFILSNKYRNSTASNTLSDVSLQHCQHRWRYNYNSGYRSSSTAATLEQKCWKCGKKIDSVKAQYFCDCGLIQPPLPARNYFDVIGVEETFDLDLEDLGRKFRNLQKLLHPDKFSTKSKEENELSAQQSSNVNKAYFTLLKPINRGLYMLELYGSPLEENEIQLDPQFLMEIMEINEELIEADDIEIVRTIAERNSEVLSDLIHKTSEAFSNKDIELAKVHLTKLKYYSNIDDKVKDLESLHSERQ